MNKKILSSALFLSAFLGLGSQAWAVGEVLKLDTYGKKYCANQAPVDLDPSNTPSYWAQVDSDSQISLYLDSALTKKVIALPVALTPLPDEAGRAQYAVDSILGPTATGYMVLNGVVKTNRKQTLFMLLKANFIRRGLLDTCSSSGFMVGKLVR
ncbi:MAG: hypothetical protein PHR16_08460 [Methylovulum sp.]|nr:hypothetical protein [Methylovulum sp.]